MDSFSSFEVGRSESNSGAATQENYLFRLLTSAEKSTNLHNPVALERSGLIQRNEVRYRLVLINESHTKIWKNVIERNVNLCFYDRERIKLKSS